MESYNQELQERKLGKDNAAEEKAEGDTKVTGFTEEASDEVAEAINKLSLGMKVEDVFRGSKNPEYLRGMVAKALMQVTGSAQASKRGVKAMDFQTAGNAVGAVDMENKDFKRGLYTEGAMEQAFKARKADPKKFDGWVADTFGEL